jgi:hypothetical protein
MNHRIAVLLMVVVAIGCQNGPSRVPPPGTGSFQAPNTYYQQPATTPPFTSPTYGTSSVSPNANPSFAPPPNLAGGSSSGGLNWQPVTQQPAIGGSNLTVNPQTTLTSIRSSSGTTSTAARQNAQLTEISQLPLAAVPQTNPYAAPPGVPPSTSPLLQTTPAAYPGFAPVGFPTGPSRANTDPWRGR